MPPADEVSYLSRDMSLPPALAAAVECLWRAYRERPDPATGLRKAIQRIESEIARHQQEQERPAGGEADGARAPGAALALPPEAMNLTLTIPGLPPPCTTLHSVRLHAGDTWTALAMPPATEAGELADKGAAALGLPPAEQYTLMHADGPVTRAVHRMMTLGALAAEDGHESRRYILLACA